MEKTALVIIDVQVAMFSYSQPPYRGQEVLANIQLLLKKARETGMPVVFIQHTADEEYTRGISTWEICPEIAPLPDEKRVEKPTWDAFHKTELDSVLKGLDVHSLIFCGMQTEFCVDTTCRRAFSMGYKAFLAEDGHTTLDSDTLQAAQIVAHHNRVLGGRFVALKSTNELLQEM